MRRLPIRVRLTAVFAAAIALVLAGVGAFVYLRLESELDRAIDSGLRSRADDVSALVRSAGEGLDDPGVARLIDADESVTQLLDRTGRVVDAPPELAARPLLRPAEVEAASAGARFLDRNPLSPEIDDHFRLLVAPAEAPRGDLVVVVGASLDDRDEALASTRTQLAIIGPVALLVASGLAYLLAGAALRPVEAMRREAEAISAVEPGRRLTVPRPRDEIARLGDTLNSMLGRLESALARERRFVADASHELRTPLALLKTELELAQRHDRTREELERAITSAAEETDRIAQLTEDMLVLARADEGALALRRDPVALAPLLERVAQRFRARASLAGREILIDAPAGTTLVADELRLEQALGNLLDNALRHGAGAIRMEARVCDGTTELHVVDAGPGLPEEFLAEAFTRFSRVDSSRSGEGAGLGLAIVDVVATAHGGSAGARNDPAGGADVWLSLPAS